MSTPQWSFKRFARLWGFALFIVVVAYLFREVLLPFVFAVVVAYILTPVVNRLSALRIGRRSLPRGAAVIMCYIVVLAALALFFTAFLPRLSSDFAKLASETPKLWEKAQNEWTPQAARWLEQRFPSLAPPPEPPPIERDPQVPLAELPSPPGTVATVTPMANGELAISVPDRGVEIERVDDKHLVLRPRESKPQRRLEEVLRERILKALSGLEGELAGLLKFGQALITGIVTTIMKIVLVLMVAAFILIDLRRVHAFTRSLVPERSRADYDVIVGGIDRGLNGVIRGQLLICLVNGILTYLGLLIFQVKYGLLLAVVAAVLSLIPIFGSIISSIPIVGIALVSGSDGIDFFRALFMLGWILAIHFIEANILSPKIMGSAAKMHPVLVIFALIAGEHSYGIVGAILAVPVASIIQTLFLFFRSRAWRSDTATQPVAPVPPA